MAQHFLLTRAAKSLTLAQVLRMPEADAETLFRAVRWPETEGAPVRPNCGGLNAYECRRPNGALLAAIVRRWAPAEAVVEHVAARPGEAPSGAFSFGRSRGVIEGVLGAQAVPVRFVTPAWWKRRVGILTGRDMKDLARSKALARWPARAEWFAGTQDHDRAEAALVGLAHIINAYTGRTAA